MELAKTTIFFRVDGNHAVGFGHFSRSLALAEMLCSAFHCIFLLQNTVELLKQALVDAYIEWEQIPSFDDLTAEATFLTNHYSLENSLVVLDGYQFDEAYQCHLRQKTNRIVYISDFIEPIHADVFINPAGGLSESDYQIRRINSQLCLGPRFSLLRKVFWEHKDNRVAYKPASKNIFVSLGGTDNLSTAVEILSRLVATNERTTIYWVTNQSGPLLTKLLEQAAQSAIKIVLLNSLNAQGMARYMARCEEAICTPSTTAYEYLAVGKGTLYLQLLVDNQQNIYDFLIENNLAFSIDNYGLTTKADRAQATSIKVDYFDGLAEKRFLKVFRQLDYELNCQLRKTTASDFLLYYRWVNEKSNRQFSTKSERVSFEQHHQWFDKKLESRHCYMYVLSYKGLAVGQIRFDIQKHQARISYALSEAYQGRGLGSYLLKSGIEQFRQIYGERITIIGAVYNYNLPSVHAFKRVGFRVRSAKDDLSEYYLKAS